MIFEGSILNRMDAMGIAEEIAPLFKSKITDKYGNQARYVSVHTIEFAKRGYDDLIEYDLDMHILSDQGDLYQSVIIREYANEHKFEEELVRYRELVNRCLLFPDIDPNPLVKFDRGRNFIIYEQVEGFHLDKFVFSPQLKNYIFGRIYAVLHGTKVERLDDKKIRLFLEFLLQHLPFTDEEKRSITTLLENHLIRFSQNFGGFESKILLRRKNIRFQFDVSLDTVDKEKIKTGDVIHASLFCEPPDELTRDRMRDMAFYFRKKAYNEFVMFGSLESTLSEIKDFLEGYSSALQVLNLPPLSEMYLSGNTLSVQLLFVSWLFESEKIRVGVFDPHEDRDLLRYTYFLLTENPFEDIF